MNCLTATPRYAAAATLAAAGLTLAWTAPALGKPSQQAPVGISDDDSISPLAAPPEPTAIPLGTGAVTGSSAREAWFRQYGTAFTRNVTNATITPFLPEPGEATGTAVIVAPGG